MTQIYLIGVPACTACVALKDWLSKRGIVFDYIDAKRAVDATWMRIHGLFPAYYPCLCVDGHLYEYAALFGEKGELLTGALDEVL